MNRYVSGVYSTSLLARSAQALLLAVAGVGMASLSTSVEAAWLFLIVTVALIPSLGLSAWTQGSQTHGKGWNSAVRGLFLILLSAWLAGGLLGFARRTLLDTTAFFGSF